MSLLKLLVRVRVLLVLAAGCGAMSPGLVASAQPDLQLSELKPGATADPEATRAAEPGRVRAARRFLARRGLVAGGAEVERRKAGLAPDRLLAGRRAAARPLLTNAAGAAVSWTTAGPIGVTGGPFGVVTGRVSSLALDPADASGNHLFVGTTGGGVWYSQNAASTAPLFQPATDGIAAFANVGTAQAGLSVGAVSVQPGGTGVVLAGLGDPNDGLDSYYGAGLLRSADGGKTWSLIQQTLDVQTGASTQNYSFIGEGFAGFAWSSTNVQLVVAAVSQAYEGSLVNAGLSGLSMEGLYYSQDSGATWHLSRITDLNGQDVQGPADGFALPDGNAATAVVWNRVRQTFVAAVRYHGYYSSPDGVTWTRLPDYPSGQPGPGLTAGHCPTQSGGVGVAGCPMFRGALAVNPQTGDTFAWTVDAFNQDQGLWQDPCGLSGSSCSNQPMNFATQLSTGALQISDSNGAQTIPNGDYNLTLAAVPGGLGAGQDTLLFAGANDQWKCSLANSCAWRNTTNATTCASAAVGEYQHALAWDAGNPLLLFAGNDSGLWRSADQVAETGSVCAATDAAHWTNLNAGMGSLSEVESLGQSATTAGTMLAGLGANGFAGVINQPVPGSGNWSQLFGGEGGPVAVDATSHINNWFVNAEAGVGIYHCSATGICSTAAFGGAGGPAIGETQVAGDGITMGYPAEFVLDPVDPTQVLVGTCRLWRGPATGAGWSATNAISPVLDGIGAQFCAGDGLIRSIAAQATPGGGEALYVGMAGNADGGATVAGHVFGAVIPPSGVVSGWTDLSLSPVANSALAFNAFGADVNALYLDPHDAKGLTLYAAIGGFASQAQPSQALYRSLDGGQTWKAITSNLPNAPVNAVVVDPQDANTVYAGTDVGVFVTRQVSSCGTGANCWAVYGAGLPLAPVTSLAIGNGPSGTVLTAGTFGRGVWQAPAVTAGTTLTTAAVSPTSLGFAAQTVGTTSAVQGVTVKTTGTASFTATGVSFLGTAAADFTETDNCVGLALARNATCTVQVRFTPSQAGSRAGVLVIQGNVPGGQMLVGLTGTANATGNITLIPAAMDFGQVQIGKGAPGQTITVNNVGGTTVSISSLAVTAPFVKTGTTCGASIGAGTSCAVVIGFSPTQAGQSTGTLTVTDALGTQTASLTGLAVVGPTDTLSTTAVAFPGTVLGQSSPTITVTIANTGGLPLTGIGTSMSGPNGADFAAVSNCGSTLGAGLSCGVAVTFTPSAALFESATLTISDAQRAQTVSLTGTGLRPGLLAMTPSAALFGSLPIGVPSSPVTFTVQNKGGSPVAQPGLSLSGAGAASFQASASTCGATLAAAASCSVQVTFTAQSSGSLTATLTAATSTLGVASVTSALSGVGLTPPLLTVSPAAIDSGSVVVGRSGATFTVNVANSGQVALTGLDFSVGNYGGATGGSLTDFDVEPPSDIVPCTFPGGVLNPGQACAVQVTFSPSVLGLETATMTVLSDNAVPQTATVSLQGTGTPAVLLQASPTTLNFPATVAGTTSAAAVLTINNLGRQAVTGLTLNFTGPYKLAAGSTCGTKLPQLSSCQTNVVFQPAAGGDLPGTITATVANLGVAPLLVPLDGMGIAVGGISPTPTALTFGSVVTGSVSPTQTVTVTNSGQAALAGLTVVTTGSYSLLGNQCAGTLAVAASCTAGIIFQPTTTGNLPGTLTVSSTSTGVSPQVVAMTGNGILSGTLTSTPTVASFGGVTVGQTGPAQTVTLTNAGGTTLSGLQFQVAGDYSLTINGCTTQLAAGVGCSFQVTFSPSQPGTRIGRVTISGVTTATGAAFTPLLVGLSGQGLPAAQLMVAPAALQFGSVAVGTNSAAQNLLVTNPGSGTLTGLGFTSAAPFSVGTGSCGSFLLPGGSCLVPVTFTPTASGAAAGVVTAVNSSLGVSAVAVAVAGNGLTAGSLALSPTSLVFAGTTIGVRSPTQTVTVTNPGAVGVTGVAIALSGVMSGDFTLTAGGAAACPSTLAATASCVVGISFKPTTAGGRTAFLTAASSAGTTAAGLSGTGLTPASLTVTPSQLNYATTLVGQVSGVQVLTVTNSGGTGISDLGIGASAAFQLDPATTTCGAKLGAGAGCAAGVIFKPQADGLALGSFSVGSPQGGTSAAAALSGVGALPPGVSTLPAALVQFQTTGVGQKATPVTVVVTNQGTAGALNGIQVTLDTTAVSAGFGLTAGTCPASLVAGASCTVQVTFSPTSARTLTGSLLIASSNGGAGGGAGQYQLTLAGLGYDFKFGVIGSTTATIIRGQTAYYTLGVTPVSNASAPVSLQCVKVPTNALCVFNPPQLTGLPANGIANVRLGITAGSASTSTASLGSRPGSGLQAILGAIAGGVLAGGIGVLAIRMRRRLRIPGLLLMAAAGAVLMAGVGGCAGAGGSASLTRIGGGTPPGNYSFTVNATSLGVTHSVTVKLVVN